MCVSSSLLKILHRFFMNAENFEDAREDFLANWEFLDEFIICDSEVSVEEKETSKVLVNREMQEESNTSEVEDIEDEKERQRKRKTVISYAAHKKLSGKGDEQMDFCMKLHEDNHALVADIFQRCGKFGMPVFESLVHFFTNREHKDFLALVNDCLQRKFKNIFVYEDDINFFQRVRIPDNEKFRIFAEDRKKRRHIYSQISENLGYEYFFVACYLLSYKDVTQIEINTERHTLKYRISEMLVIWDRKPPEPKTWLLIKLILMFLKKDILIREIEENDFGIMYEEFMEQSPTRNSNIIGTLMDEKITSNEKEDSIEKYTNLLVMDLCRCTNKLAYEVITSQVISVAKKISKQDDNVIQNVQKVLNLYEKRIRHAASIFNLDSSTVHCVKDSNDNDKEEFVIDTLALKNMLENLFSVMSEEIENERNFSLVKKIKEMECRVDEILTYQERNAELFDAECKEQIKKSRLLWTKLVFILNFIEAVNDLKRKSIQTCWMKISECNMDDMNTIDGFQMLVEVALMVTDGVR